MSNAENPLDPTNFLDEGPSDSGVSRHAYHDDTPALPAAEPAPEPEIPTAAAPEPQSDPYRSEIDSLRQTVNALLYQRQQPQQAPQQPQPQQQAYQPPKPWETKEFLSAEDTRALLTSDDPRTYLNRALNSAVQAAYDPLVQELQRRDQMMAYIYGEQQQRTQQQQARELAQHNINTFYSAHPEVEPFADLVPLEVEALAREQQMNPAAFVNRSNAELYQMLAERVLSRVETYRSSGTAEPEPAPQRRAQRTTLERGSGTRPQAQPEPTDTNKRELGRMFKHLRVAS